MFGGAGVPPAFLQYVGIRRITGEMPAPQKAFYLESIVCRSGGQITKVRYTDATYGDDGDTVYLPDWSRLHGSGGRAPTRFHSRRLRNRTRVGNEVSRPSQ